MILHSIFAKSSVDAPSLLLVRKVPLRQHISAFTPRRSLRSEHFCPLQVRANPIRFLRDHEERVKRYPQRQTRDRIEVDRVLLDFHIVPFPVALVNLLLVLPQVLITDRNDRRVPKVLHWPQVCTTLSKQKNLLGRNLLGCTSSNAPGISVFTLNILLIRVMLSSSSRVSNGIGVPNSSTFS